MQMSGKSVVRQKGRIVLVGGVLVLLVMSCLATPAWAERTVSLTAVTDLGLYGGNPNENRGAGGRMDLGAAQSSLVKFNLASVLAPGETISGATLQFFNARGGYTFNMSVVAYPLLVSWQEGTGTTGGVVGSTGGPIWGPVQIGDAVYNYRSVTAVSADATPIATAGVPWGAPGARGIGSDLADQLMISQAWVKSNLQQPAQGAALPVLDLTPAGLSVLNGWASGALANNGMSLWATGTGTAAVVTREYTATAGAAPQLVLTITPVPEPVTLSLLALAMAGVILRRRQHEVG